LDASELAVTDRDEGRIILAGGYDSHGESVHRVRSDAGEIAKFWLGVSKLLPEEEMAEETLARYEPPVPAP
jgi:hypothetical protein